MPAVNVGVDRDVFPDAEPLGSVAERIHRPDQFMAGGQRELGEELAVVDMEVRSADPCLLYSDAHLAWSGNWCRDLRDRETTRGVVDNGFHAAPSRLN